MVELKFKKLDDHVDFCTYLRPEQSCGGMDIFQARNVQVIEAMTSYVGGQPFHPPAAFPPYQPILFQKQKEYHIHPTSEWKEADLPNNSFLFYYPHCLYHYGHFILESLPKLLLANDLVSKGMDFTFLIGRNAPHFIKKHLDLAIPNAKKFILDERTVYKGKFFTCSVEPHYHIHPTVVNWYKKYSNRISENVVQDFPKLLFMEMGEHILNREEVTMMLGNIGFSTISPEHMPIEHQIAMFHRAEIIAGQHSSRLHNSVFSQSRTAVVALGWCAKVQPKIARAFNQIYCMLPMKFIQGGIDVDETIRSMSGFSTQGKTMKINVSELKHTLLALNSNKLLPTGLGSGV